MLDTLKYSRILEAVGISRDQAEAHIKIISEIVEGDLATKQDIKGLENKLVQLEYRLIIKLGAVVGAIVTLAIAVTAAITKLL
jgi:hypothetical protein